MSGAVDLSVCHWRYCSHGYCEICGFVKHSAAHGPFYGEKPGSKPYLHEFEMKKSYVWSIPMNKCTAQLAKKEEG